MNILFTPTEAAALLYLPPKRVYKELEHKIISPVSDVPRLSFVALIYLRALKELNFEFSVKFRLNFYQRLVEARENHLTRLEVAKFFFLQLDGITAELSELVTQFYQWKQTLVINDHIMGGEAVFPNSRLSVRRIGGMLAKGESYDVILEDYPYLTPNDLKFAEIYVKAYPIVGRPKNP